MSGNFSSSRFSSVFVLTACFCFAPTQRYENNIANLIQRQMMEFSEKTPLSESWPASWRLEWEKREDLSSMRFGRMRRSGSVLTVSHSTWSRSWQHVGQPGVHQPLSRVGHPRGAPARKRSATVFCWRCAPPAPPQEQVRSRAETICQSLTERIGTWLIKPSGALFSIPVFFYPRLLANYPLWTRWH